MVRKVTLPQWLDGQTIAVLTLGTALCVMTQVGFMDLRSEIRLLRSELRLVRSEIRLLRCELVGGLRQLRCEIRQLRTEIAVRTKLHGLDHHCVTSNGESPPSR